MEKRELFSNKRNIEWLPGTIVRGEGIFLEFSRARLDSWYEENKSFLQEREKKLTAGRAEYLRMDVDSLSKVSAKMVLIHTFAHILINELIFDCGYGSASLRERLYSSDRTNPTMNAVLIYTAAGDTEGSMGAVSYTHLTLPTTPYV